MAHAETQDRTESGRGSHALVPIADAAQAGGRPIVPSRAPAGFVMQLMLGTDQGLRTGRLERTRRAAARYAQTAERLGSKQGA